MAVALVLVVSSVALEASASNPTVGVLNVPPQFRQVTLGARDGYDFVDVTVSDYNSWRDVLRVDVVVLDDYGAPLGHVRFLQYQDPNATATPSADFQDLSGGLLRQEVSYYWASNLTDTYIERSELNLTFALRPVRGSSLDLTAVDLAGAWAEVRVDYSLSAIGGPGGDILLPPPLAFLDYSNFTALLAGGMVTVLLTLQRYIGVSRLLRRVRGRGR